MLKNGCITIDEYKATIENGEVTTIEKGSCASSETSNFGGQVITEIPETGHTGVKAIVYLDPTDITAECNEELASANVNSDDSKTGIKSGCMKWYVFKDENGYYTMLLDHNTTATTAWITQDDYEQTGNQTTTPLDVGLTYASTNMTNGLPTGIWDSSGTNNRGPITLLNQLKTDTSNWDESFKLSEGDSYIAEWTGLSDYYNGNQKYTINYNGYKARLISVEEIYEITGVQSGYLDNKCSSSGSCSAGKNLYAWLFDYTGVGVPSGSVGAPDCTQNGCNAGKNSDTYYWTSSSQYSDSDTAYVMVYFGSLSQTSITANTNIGIRPVIKISKDKLGIN